MHDIQYSGMPDETILWRYMDVSKLLDLLVNQHVVFPRMDAFEDVYEGRPPKYKEALKQYALKTSRPLGEIDIIAPIDNFYRLSAVRTYISCWHMNNFESAGMWKLYCTTKDSLAIKTTLGKLKQSLKNPESNGVNKIGFGKVIYDDNIDSLVSRYLDKDLKNEPIGISHYEVIFNKRPSFEHEKELRVIAYDVNKLIEPAHAHLSDEELSKTTPKIQAIKCDVNSLIDEIVMYPKADDWFVTTLQKTISQLGFDFKVTKSELYKLK